MPALAEHSINHYHDIAWEDATVVDAEPNMYCCRALEARHFHSLKSSVFPLPCMDIGTIYLEMLQAYMPCKNNNSGRGTPSTDQWTRLPGREPEKWLYHAIPSDALIELSFLFIYACTYITHLKITLIITF